MENPNSWTDTHRLINEALDYQSPGEKQATKVFEVLQEKNQLKMEVFEEARVSMTQQLAAEIDGYLMRLRAGYCGSSLESTILQMLKQWNILAD